MMKKGFTLIELLAVIVVLGIIALIAVTAVSGFINNSKVNSFKSDAKILIKNIDYNMYTNIDNPSYDITSINQSNIESTLGVSVRNYQTVEVSLLRGRVYLIIQGQNNYSNLIAYGTYDSMQTTSINDYNKIKDQLTYDDSKFVNAPQLVKGMVPIKWDGTNWVTTLDSDLEWYDYSDKKWANAKTIDGSMWVWIPRYIYKISSGWHTANTGTIDIQFSKGIDDNWNSSAIGSIDTRTTSDASNNTWTNHPGFTFGNDEVTGIWVAKFEATAVEGVAHPYTSNGSCGSLDDVLTKTVQILPNKMSWRCINVGNMFTNVRSMETNSVYGWETSGTGIDTHLMKNIEWGVISYLAKSVTYGQGTDEIYINNSQTMTTGCAGNSSTDTAYNGCQNTYDTSNGIKASTTGTIYGVYDINGGAWEYVSAYIDNSATVLSTYGSSLLDAVGKYKDTYTPGTTDDQANNYALNINKKGDALYETSNTINGSYSWFGDNSYNPYSTVPLFLRGGRFNYTTTAGAFAFTYRNGMRISDYGFRPILIVKSGL